MTRQVVPSTSAASVRSESAAVQVLPFLGILLQVGLFLVVLYLYDLESRAFFISGLSRSLRFRFITFCRCECAALLCRVVSVLSSPGLWISTGKLDACGVGPGRLDRRPRAVHHRALPPAGAFRRAHLLLADCGRHPDRHAGRRIPAPWSAAIWPVLASMFMFRTALYLHALKYEKQPVTLVDALCYFFMLPNPCFPLFPVVDFQTFRRDRTTTPRTVTPSISAAHVDVPWHDASARSTALSTTFS